MIQCKTGNDNKTVNTSNLNNGVLDANNSTAVVLLAGETYTGTGIKVTDFVEVIVSVFTDVPSAVDGLKIQYSSNNIDWDHSDDYTVPATTGKNYSVQRISTYYRIVYVNGTSDQTAFRLTSIQNKFRGKPSSHRLSDSITTEDDAELTTTVMKVVGSDPTVFHNVDVQHPLPADGDSVYLKDIDVSNSDNGGFSGVITDYFDNLKTVNFDASATNPKVIKIWLNRSMQTNSIGFGCDDLTKSFSNIKIEFLGSGEEVRFTKDLSTDSTKRNSFVIDLPPLALNGIQISFLTADEIGLSNIILWKATDVNARLSAVSGLTGDVEDIASFRNTLSVNQALVHQVGINEYFRRDLGGSTTLASPVTSGDTDINVVSAVGFVIGNFIRLEGQRSHFHVLNIVGTVFSLNRPIDKDIAAGGVVAGVDISLNNTGTIAAPISSILKPPVDERWQITRFLITMLDSTSMDNGKFGGRSPLPNALVIREVKNGVVSTSTHWNTNQDLKDDMFDVEYDAKAPAGFYGLSGRWTLTQSQFVGDLDGATGDYFEILNQDGLTLLDDFKIKAQGRLFGG